MARPAPSVRTTLTHQQIAEAAIARADAEGIESVSIRRLAASLGVAPMALYRYVANKDELFELMVDAVFAADVVAIQPGEGWREFMHRFADRTRAVLLEHPWLGQVSAQVLSDLTPNRMAGLEHALRSLDGLGLDIEQMRAVVDAVSDYARGAASREVALHGLMQRQGLRGGDDLRDAYAPHMSWLMGTGRYPTFYRWTQEATNKDDADGRFEFGLSCVLDGIAVQLGI
jgi:AcrR family transcriptional regulator